MPTYRVESFQGGALAGGYQLVAGPPVTFQQLDGTGAVVSSRPATPAEVAEYNAYQVAANQVTIQGNLATHLAQVEGWVAANPAGAVLTAGQTLWLAQSLAGLIRLLLNMTATTGQAN